MTSDPSFRSKDRYRYFLADPRTRYVDDYVSQMYFDLGASVDFLGAELEGKFSYLSKVPFVKEEDRLPQLNAIYIPEGVNDLETRQKLLNNFNLEIGAGLGVLAGKVWRIGLMGHSSKKENIDHCLNSLAQVI